MPTLPPELLYRRPWPWWLKTVLILATIVAAGVLFVFTVGRFAEARWNAHAGGLRKAGAVLTLAELENLRPKIPPEANGARLINDFLAEWEKLDQAKSRQLSEQLRKLAVVEPADFFKGVPRSYAAKANALHDASQPALAPLVELRNYPLGRFAIKHEEEPMFTVLHHLTSAREAAQLLQVNVALSLLEHELPTAAERIESLWQIARYFDGEPIIISRLTQISLESMAIRSLESTLRVGQIAGTTLASFDDRLTAALAENGLALALQGDRAYFVEMCDFLALRGARKSGLQIPVSSGPSSSQVFLPWLPRALIRSDQLICCRLYDRLVNAAGDSVALIKEGKAIDNEMMTMSRRHVLARTLFPSLSRATVLDAKQIALLRCTRIALAAERHCLKTGKLPLSMDDLLPSLTGIDTRDPFDNLPLRFAAIEGGIVIYSIDENMQDDGGAVETLPSERRPRDIGFRLLQPDRRGLFLVDDPPTEPE